MWLIANKILLEYITTYCTMEIYSLEEDDGHELFLTQNSATKDINGRKTAILGDGMDFQSPCALLIHAADFNIVGSQYKDISDDDFEIPSSQVSRHEERLAYYLPLKNISILI